MPTVYVLSKTKTKKYHNVSSDNYHFYVREKSLYVDCMGGFSEWSHFSVKSRAFCTVSIKTYYPNKPFYQKSVVHMSKI